MQNAYGMLPRPRITDLLLKVDGWTGFSDCLTHRFRDEFCGWVCGVITVGHGNPPGQHLGHSAGGSGSTTAVYQRAEGIEAGRCTAAAFALLGDPRPVERRDMAFASNRRFGDTGRLG